MSAWPKITLVTPSYQQAAYLEQTLLSVFAQDYPNLEYLVFDGGSTDGSVDILKRHSGKITRWVSEKDGGQAAAIARGFNEADGEILGWLNSDDVLCPGALLAVGRWFQEHPEAEAVNGGGYFVDTQGEPLRFGRLGFTRGIHATHGRLLWLGQEGLYQPSAFFRRSAYQAVGGVDAKLRFAMDRDLFIRLAARRPIEHLDLMLSACRVHDATKTGTLQDVCAADNLALDARYGVLAAPRWQRLLHRWRHRVPDLLLKAGWALSAVLGRPAMPAVRYGPPAS